jgi:hypothetical protein
MKIVARPAPSAAICLLLWLVWALTNRGWIGAIPGLRTWAGYFLSELLLSFLLIAAWLILLMRNLWVWRRRPRRAQVHANLLCLGLAALLAFALPSRAATMFYLWHDDFQNIAHSHAPTDSGSHDLFRNHWKYGTVHTHTAPDGGTTVHFDYGVGVAGLLYNPHDQPVESEWTVFCDRSHDEGGFIRRLEPNWFLCYHRMYY